MINMVLRIVRQYPPDRPCDPSAKVTEGILPTRRVKRSDDAELGLPRDKHLGQVTFCGGLCSSVWTLVLIFLLLLRLLYHLLLLDAIIILVDGDFSMGPCLDHQQGTFFASISGLSWSNAKCYPLGRSYHLSNLLSHGEAGELDQRVQEGLDHWHLR